MAGWNPRANEIFLKAVEHSTVEDCRSFIDRVCAGDTALRAEVEELLQAHAAAGSFLAAPAVARTIDMPAETPLMAPAGTVIGPYKLLQQIGEGGMGAVYMAEQAAPVRRKVALKIIKPGMDTREVIARFEAERQALALMDHPNIARVLDGGTTSAGRPYFVMDLVKGMPITRYCDEHHLNPRQRLELFIPVCQAVQHAHQKGIIHRDLKPSNVLVALYDGKPVPKVIDFGVAKATGQALTDKTLVTGFGAIVGTLEYMSPEQARLNQLDIDTRSDIYSLGVLLYELLTGCTPFDGKRLRSAAFDEMLRIIREEEPPKPSTRLSSSDMLPSIAANRNVEPARLGRALRGELDWIVMKALEKDRNRRYETANGLAMDVQRHLSDEQVLACPSSTVYRLRKFAWRNRQALASAVFIGLMLLAGAGGALVYAAKQRALAHERAEFSVEQGKSLRRLEGIQRQTEADLYQALLRQSAALREGRQPGYRAQVWTNLQQAAALPACDPDDIRRELLACLGDPIGLEPGSAESVRRVQTAAIPKLFRPLVTADPKLSAVGPDGTLLAASNARVTLHGQDGNVLASTDRVLGGIYDLEFTSDGRFLVAGCEEGVVVWTIPDLRPATFYRGHNAFQVAVQPGGSLIASMGTTITLWSLRSNRLVATLKPPAAAKSVEFSADGKLVLAVDGQQVVAGWHVGDTPEKLELAGHDGAVPTVAFSPGGVLLASAGKDRKVKVWNTRSGALVHTGEGHKAAIESVVFSPDGAILASGDYVGSIRFWNTATGQEVGQLNAPCGQVWRLQFEPGGNYLVAGGVKGVAGWTIEQTPDTAVAEQLFFLPTPDAVYDLAVHPGGKEVVFQSSGKLSAYNLTDARLSAFTVSNAFWLRGLYFDPAGDQLQFFSFDRRLKAVDWPQGQPTEVADLVVGTVAPSPDGRWIGATDAGFRKLAVYDLKSGQEWTALPAQDAEMWALSWSPDGTRLAAGLTDGGVVIWDLDQVRARLAEFAIKVPTTATLAGVRGTDELSGDDLEKIVQLRGVDIKLRETTLRKREEEALRQREAEEERKAEALAREKRLPKIREMLLRQREAEALAQEQRARTLHDKKWELQVEEAVRENTAIVADRLARLGPANPDTHSAMGLLAIHCGYRALLKVQAGHLNEAIADLDNATQLNHGKDEFYEQSWTSAAALYLYVGDVERYRGACDWLLDYADKIEVHDPFGRALDQLAWQWYSTGMTCSLAPDSIPDFSRAERLAERAITGTEKHAARPRFLVIKGLAEYRAGRNQRAVDWLKRFAINPGGQHYTATGFAALAMAQHQLGDEKGARASLRSAHDIVARLPQDKHGHYEWLHREILCREADQLVTGIEIPLPGEGPLRWRHQAARAQVYEFLEEWSNLAAAATHAIDEDTRNSEARLLRAKAHQRLGQGDRAIADAVAAFEIGTELSQSGEGHDWFLLAMAHWQLGEKDMARELYDWGMKWMEENQPDNEELRRLCAEAAALLGREVPPTLKQPPVLTPGPALLKPAAGATLDNGTFDRSKLMVWEFNWSDVPGATQYHLYVIGPNAKVPAINNPSLTLSSYRFEQKGYVIDQLRLGSRWKVRALVKGIWTAWSEERTFDVAPLDDKKPPSPKK